MQRAFRFAVGDSSLQEARATRVFPPTFAGAVYAVEQRRVFDSPMARCLPSP